MYELLYIVKNFSSNFLSFSLQFLFYFPLLWILFMYFVATHFPCHLKIMEFYLFPHKYKYFVFQVLKAILHNC